MTATTYTAMRPTLFSRLRTAVDRRTVYRNVVRDLSRLDERELADIGLARGDISDVARERAEQHVPRA